MALSYTQYIGDGTTRTFNITFPYIAQNHVVARVNGNVEPFTWLSANTVQFQTPPAASAVVDIRRQTPRTELLVDFVDGSTLVETDLDLSALQVFYLAQEAFDLGEASLGVTDDGSFSGLQRRISNVLDPVLPQDVATKNFVETSATSQVNLARQSRDEAVSAKNAAQTAQTAAQTARSGAEAARTAAETARDQAQTHAATAQGHSNTASTKASEAQISASNAAGSAATAVQKANEAAASAASAAMFDPSSFYTKAETDARYLTATSAQTNFYTKSQVDTALNGKLATTGGTVSGTINATGLQVNGNEVWHTGNFTGGNFWLKSDPITTVAFNASTAASNSETKLTVRNASGTGDTGVAAMAFECQGSYGIKLHLRADGYFGFGGWSRAAWSWYSDPSGNVVAAGNVSAYSDPRLKDDVAPIEDALDIVERLNGVRFTWNNKTKLIGRPGFRDIGVLADEVEAVLPELVSLSIPDNENEGTRWRTVAYDKIVPVLIEAVKELSARVRELEGH